MVNWQIVLSQHGFHRTDHEEWLHERWENDRFYLILQYFNYNRKKLLSRINLGVKGIWPSPAHITYSYKKANLVFRVLKALDNPHFLPFFINEPELKPFLDVWFRYE